MGVPMRDTPDSKDLLCSQVTMRPSRGPLLSSKKASTDQSSQEGTYEWSRFRKHLRRAYNGPGKYPHVVSAIHRSMRGHDEWVFLGRHGTLVLTCPAKVVDFATEIFNLTLRTPAGGVLTLANSSVISNTR